MFDYLIIKKFYINHYQIINEYIYLANIHIISFLSCFLSNKNQNLKR